ncbi:hypothetical protein ACM66B_000973 [Microbotryomycetes sp. NB124-2]
MSFRAVPACSTCLKQLQSSAIRARAIRSSTRPRSAANHAPARPRTASTDASQASATTSHLGPDSQTAKPRRTRWPTTVIVGGVGAAAVAYGAWSYLSPTHQQKLSPYSWTPLKVTKVTQVTADSSIITLQIPKSLLPPTSAESATHQQISSLYVMQPDLQIQRPYTPLDGACFDPASETTECQLLVKRYSDGEVSRYLHRLRAGDDLRVRGPVPTWQFDSTKLDEVVFIAGGTGVTPAYQFLKSLPPTASTNVTVVYASPSPSQILIKQELDQLIQKRSKASIQYLVDVMDNQPLSAVTRQFSVGRVNVDKLRTWIGPAQQSSVQRIVVVCGPEPMVEAVAGPRARDLSQGPVGGMLLQLGYTNDEVVKL